MGGCAFCSPFGRTTDVDQEVTGRLALLVRERQPILLGPSQILTMGYEPSEKNGSNLKKIRKYKNCLHVTSQALHLQALAGHYNCVWCGEVGNWVIGAPKKSLQIFLEKILEENDPWVTGPIIIKQFLQNINFAPVCLITPLKKYVGFPFRCQILRIHR